jgi:DNA-directed RNA polymerase III subunit RPC1
MMIERKFTVAQSNAPKKIAKIQFGTFDTDEIKLAAELRVSNRELYQMPLRNPAPHGCLDTRLGISDKASACKTCG